MEEVKNLVRFVTIPNFPNYCIGEDGRVWSDNRKRYLKWYRGKGCERPHVTLFNNGVSSKLFVATLVAKAFVTNPKPNVYKYVRYKDGNSANNHWSNLEWCRNQTGSKYGKAKIFQSIVKGTNFFTPIIDSYHTVGNHIIELSCSEKDNQHGLYNREVNGITFKGKYGVTVITNNGNGWERSIELDKLCYSRKEAMEYIKSLGDKENEV